MISIALDAVGGDHAPAQIVRGAVDFVRSELGEGVRVLLVGDAQIIAAELVACDADGDSSIRCWIICP
ncbi:hypothetical protein [Armatimonas sp.]|uniref:hypothetical protein n=1 Tax=Armatimonas sp. TaxID=1872638 RepID=UPI00286AD649|nr:hypothetical protein [Armatimonas sp.]